MGDRERNAARLPRRTGRRSGSAGIRSGRRSVEAIKLRRPALRWPRPWWLAVALVAIVAIAVAAMARRNAEAAAVGDPQRGRVVFATNFTLAQGLGPLFNNTSCLGCHNTPAPGGGGPDGLATVLRVGQLTTAGFDPMIGRGGPLARARSVSELGMSCALAAGVP